VAPSGALVIGDTPYDADAAAKVGIRKSGILSGGFAESYLRRAGCVAIFADPADLLRNYDVSPLAAGSSGRPPSALACRLTKHQISGVPQQQGGGHSLAFTSRAAT
jgi:hypothetical protein